MECTRDGLSPFVGKWFTSSMEGYEASTYGERFAEVYDQTYGSMFDVEGCVDFLAELAKDGRALELAIGTGRIALPLLQRGVQVTGIDISPAMVEKLRAKPGAERIEVVMGDFADVDVDGRYPLVYLVFNTLFALTSQEEQVRCFRNVATKLEPGGAFVIEAFVPNMKRFDEHQRVAATRVEVDSAELEVSRHDPVTQTSDSLHVVISETGTKLYPVRIRYAWPAELDLMARLAGLELAARYGSWRKGPFTSDSRGHVSVYARAQSP
ncbi:MAG: class I SAM-dependent methyltransferase [Actinomycetota bacterium]|nr:class I SAM-dependent methyltransferase [Actinomycetota bacterium]